MGKFILKKRANGEFQFNLKANNHETILTSEGYSSKAMCKNGIDSVRINSQEDNNYDKRTSINGKYYFNLKAANGEIIGTSELYERSFGRDNGIASVKSNAPDAEIEDIT